MDKEKIKFIHDSLGEAKDFSKEVRVYLYEIEKQRSLTDKEKELWEKTHRIHVKTEDSRMMIQEEYNNISSGKNISIMGLYNRSVKTIDSNLPKSEI